jgi:hypothetical protein
VPALITSDGGVQFTAMRLAVMQRLGIKQKLCTAFHPQGKGLIERFHRRMKEASKARAAAADWPAHLPWVMLGLRICPREVSAVSSTELMYGTPLTLPGQFIAPAEPLPEQFVQQLQSGTPCAAPFHAPRSAADGLPGLPTALQRATCLYVKSPPAATDLAPAFRGLYAVNKKGGEIFHHQNRRSI